MKEQIRIIPVDREKQAYFRGLHKGREEAAQVRKEVTKKEKEKGKQQEKIEALETELRNVKNDIHRVLWLAYTPEQEGYPPYMRLIEKYGNNASYEKELEARAKEEVTTTPGLGEVA